jgi:opacity protein-like surface antigen
MKRIIEVFCLLLLATGWGLGQDNEVSFSIGPTFTSDQKLRTDTLLPGCQVAGCQGVTTFSNDASVSFSLAYARRITAMGPTALYLELPMLAQPGHDVEVVSTNRTLGFSGTVRGSAFFFTPAARIQFLPKGRISPWATAGYGVARLSQDLSSSRHTKGAAQFGGGLDFKTSPHLAIRGEVRDFWTPSMVESGPVATLTSATALTTHIHHFYTGGGVVLKF